MVVSAHAHAIGSRVRVYVQRGHHRDRFFSRSRWYAGTVVAQTGLAPQYHYPSPSYTVRLRDGVSLEHCHHECVRVAS